MVYNKPGPPSGSDDEPGPCATRSGRVHHHFLREGRVCYIPYEPMVKSYVIVHTSGISWHIVSQLGMPIFGYALTRDAHIWK